MMVEKRARRIKEQKKFKILDSNKMFDPEYKDAFLEHMAKNKDFAFIYFKPMETLKWNFNSNDKEVLHAGKESVFPTWYGKAFRKNYLYFEQVQAL